MKYRVIFEAEVEAANPVYAVCAAIEQQQTFKVFTEAGQQFPVNLQAVSDGEACNQCGATECEHENSRPKPKTN